jgi:hypothetical protein
VGDRSYLVEPLMDDAELDSRSSTGTIYWEGPVTLRHAKVATETTVAAGTTDAAASAQAAQESSGAAATKSDHPSATPSNPHAPLGRGYLELTGYAGRLDL